MTTAPNRGGSGTESGRPPAAAGVWAGLLPVEGHGPAGRVGGRFDPPASKSLLQRALVLASRASGTTRLVAPRHLELRRTNPGPWSLAEGDVAAACVAVRGLGARLERSGAELIIHGAGNRAPWTPDSAALDAGESGTLARLLTALAALLPTAGTRTRVVGAGTLLGRSSPALARALREAGARWIAADGAPPASWPAEIVATGELPQMLRLVSPGSSQELSALLVALAARGAPAGAPAVVELSGVLPSRPYLELTRACLADFGVAVEVERGAGPERFLLDGELHAPAAPWTVEPDASAAAVALAAAALSGGSLVVPGLDASARQGDVRIVRYLAAFGCESASEDGALAVTSGPEHGAELDLAGEPDLAPALAAVAAAAALRAGATSRLCGLVTLPAKESNRLAILAAGLDAAGLAVDAGPESLTIGPGPGRSADAPALLLDPAGDHRMAFAFALLGLCLPGIRVADPSCVAKSWPGFWEDLERLGARVARSPRGGTDEAGSGPRPTAV